MTVEFVVKTEYETYMNANIGKYVFNWSLWKDGGVFNEDTDVTDTEGLTFETDS
jgi:hypothetical protein